jgi:AAA+ ATPase superfamily predicted ATPase
MPNSPYKFLGHYESSLDDRKVFFGRERETRILLADVLVSRLVVLFARTGTGKTSLINAGVRPRLEEHGYGTFLIRVRKDPVESARAELQERLGVRLRGSRLFELLEGATESQPRQSMVLFFDQFEEFFIFVKAGSKKGQEFISDVARISENADLGVHLVFSMREEWFHEMDEFRDEIPTIFTTIPIFDFGGSTKSKHAKRLSNQLEFSG